MKRILFVVALMILAKQVVSQQFQKGFEIALPDSIQQTQASWTDLDNDGLLDILLMSKTAAGKAYFQFVKGDTLAKPALHPKIKSIVSFNAFSLADYDRDNKIDIIVSGEKNGTPTTAVYINLGDFEFVEKILNVPPFQIMKFADMDNDARPEWILSGEENGSGYVKFLKQIGAFSWKVVHDTLKIKATALEVIDATGDGQMDLFVSGLVKPDSLVTGLLINKGGFYFKPGLPSQRSGVTTTADVNLDGFFDVLMMGQDQAGGLRSELFQSTDGTYTIKNDPIKLKGPHPFAADFNSNGIVDVNYIGKTAANDGVNIIQFGTQDYDTLDHINLVGQYPGDAEHDGDLDLLQVIQGNPLRLVFYENNPATKNLGPGVPKKGVAVTIFNRLFVYWDRSTDDHTAVPAITYDLYLNGNPRYQPGDFDLLNERRLLVSHGNNGTQNFRLLRNTDGANFDFSVQAVDNAFHASGLCFGVRAPCAEIEKEELAACSKEAVKLTAPADVLWFSFSKGFLGIASELDFQADTKDTLFYFNPAESACAALKAWTIKINNDTLKTEVSEKYACQDAEIVFSVEPGWPTVEWKSQVKGNLGTTNAISYKVLQPDSVFVTLSNGSGCTINRKTAVKISKPTLVLAGDNYKIMKGSEVQLSVSGAQRFVWTPANGLSQTDIGNPVASPSSSIQYQVTGYDSLGCTDKATINVIVEGAGFIPNLFTPNDDGQNDQLKVYGLSSVKDFTFSIYNREGSMVFKTTDVVEAVQRGWDGTKGGAKQPSGVYFWKVKGELTSGDRILLNGKDSGSIVLVR